MGLALVVVPNLPPLGYAANSTEAGWRRTFFFTLNVRF